MMKKLLSLSLLLATATVLADGVDNAVNNVDVSVNNNAGFNVDLTVQVVKNDGSVVSNAVKFTKSNMQHEIDGMTFEVTTQADAEAGHVVLDLKIYRRNEQGEMVLLCNGNGKVALNKEETVQITERSNDDEVVQTMTLTFLIAE
jgi:hypothetical protein